MTRFHSYHVSKMYLGSNPDPCLYVQYYTEHLFGQAVPAQVQIEVHILE
jgi:hypothetical protein